MSNDVFYKATQLLSEALEWTEGLEAECRDEEQRQKLAEWRVATKALTD